ncbi:hypothetical protein GIB67_039103 [Kingdonia uniflora]|uniref:Uncharacterized protein n=1 Tax=Kingdonia uniflora TaxID=39325 RepID=A0A7J7LLA0_9MAGN|nr:hypothetical protein GIB67_039103 [Kingdonia uniflora]
MPCKTSQSRVDYFTPHISPPPCRVFSSMENIKSILGFERTILDFGESSHNIKARSEYLSNLKSSSASTVPCMYAADAVQENPEPQSNQHSDDRQEGPQVADGYKEEAPQHIKPISNMKIVHLMELPPVGLTCGLSGYGSKEIYYPAPLMNRWMKYSQLQPPHDSALARLTSPPRPSSSSASRPRPVFDQELPDFPVEEFHTGVGSQPKPVSVEKQVSMEKHMANPDNFEFPVTEATMMVTLGNSGTFGGNKRSIPNSGSGNGPIAKGFSSSIQSGSGLAPVAEDIPWDLPEPSFKLRRLPESCSIRDPGPSQTQHPLVDLPMEKVTDAI